MEKKITIRENTAEYMQELREWAGEARKGGLEEMAAFFRNRLGEYEEHMSMWNAAYKRIGTMIPEQTEKLLDLGCGTGLELDEISAARPSLQITGIDLSPDMLAVLAKKHPQVRLIQADYFSYDFGASVYDMACLLYTSFLPCAPGVPLPTRIPVRGVISTPVLRLRPLRP